MYTASCLSINRVHDVPVVEPYNLKFLGALYSAVLSCFIANLLSLIDKGNLITNQSPLYPLTRLEVLYVVLSNKPIR